MKVLLREVIPHKPRKPPEPVIPVDSSVIISENGDFIYRADGKHWTCLLTPQERKLVRAVAAAKDQKLDGNEAHKTLGLQVKYGSEKPIREIVRKINRKLDSKKIPLKMSFSDWIIRFSQKMRI